MPALMCTTVPPAKSIGATAAAASSPAGDAEEPGREAVRRTGQQATAPDHVGEGEVGEVDPESREDEPVPNLARSAMAPLMSATVMMAKVIWKATLTMAG